MIAVTFRSSRRRIAVSLFLVPLHFGKQIVRQPEFPHHRLKSGNTVLSVEIFRIQIFLPVKQTDSFVTELNEMADQEIHSLFIIGDHGIDPKCQGFVLMQTSGIGCFSPTGVPVRCCRPPKALRRNSVPQADPANPAESPRSETVPCSEEVLFLSACHKNNFPRSATAECWRPSAALPGIRVSGPRQEPRSAFWMKPTARCSSRGKPWQGNRPFMCDILECSDLRRESYKKGGSIDYLTVEDRSIVREPL